MLEQGFRTPAQAGVQFHVRSWIPACVGVRFRRDGKWKPIRAGRATRPTFRRACLHTAMATRPERVLVKPGMGFDEGMTVVADEMNQVLAVLHSRAKL